MKQALIVFSKELADALRDRRTLLRLLIPALLMGPLLLMALSGLIASLEERADKREVLAVGIDTAPTLKNFIERQTYTLKAAPADYEARLRATTVPVARGGWSASPTRTRPATSSSQAAEARNSVEADVCTSSRLPAP